MNKIPKHLTVVIDGIAYIQKPATLAKVGDMILDPFNGDVYHVADINPEDNRLLLMSGEMYCASVMPSMVRLLEFTLHPHQTN